MLIILSLNTVFTIGIIAFLLICFTIVYFANKFGQNHYKRTETKIVNGKEIITVTKIKNNKDVIRQQIIGKQIETKKLSEKEKNKIIVEQQKKFDKMDKERKKQKRNEKISKFFGKWKKNYFKKRKIQKNINDNEKRKKAALTSLLRTIFKI